MTKFETALREKVLVAIANLEPGTVGISQGNLWQLVCSGLGSVDGAPQGTNAPFVARQIFNALVSEPAFAKFVYPDTPAYPRGRW